MKDTIPIIEFDPSRECKIRPENFGLKKVLPERCVMCFFQEAIDRLVKKYPSEIVTNFKSEGGIDRPVYSVDFEGAPVALATALLGGPAAAGILDELAAHGANKFLALGSAGVLDKEVQHGKLMIPTSALRHEGTSYHYVAPSRWIDVDSGAVSAIENYFINNKIPFIKGKTWTTDAFYRETNSLFESRKTEGCISVEMECASWAAAAKYNGVKFGQILYGGDCLDGDVWGKRGWLEESSEDRRYWMLEQAMRIVKEF